MDEGDAARASAAIARQREVYEARVRGTVLADSRVDFLLDAVMGDLVVRIIREVEAREEGGQSENDPLDEVEPLL